MFFLAFLESIQLLPDGSLLIHVAMILVMIWILNRTFFRPINRVIETREKNKGGHSSEAKEILSDAESKKTAYSKALQEARTEGYDLIEKERNQAVKDKQNRVEGAKNEVAQMLDTEHSNLEQQIAGAKEVISSEAEKMAEKISANILRGN